MTNKVDNKVALKSGIWYVVGDILFRAIGFLTMPIFTRVLSKDEFGEFNNLTSWGVILFFIISLDLHSTIVRSKLDYADDLASYSTSILFLSTIINMIVYLIFKSNAPFFSDLLSIQEKFFNILFLYLLFLEAYYIYVTYERANYRYKKYTLATGLVIILVNLLSIALVFIMENKLDGRVIGFHLPYILVGAIMYLLIVKRSRKLKMEYVKYALSISLPLLPHLISLNILSSSDKVMIMKMIGKSANATYSVAYMVSNILIIIYNAMNKAWAPWFMDTMKSGKRKPIKDISRYYFLVFLAIIVGTGLMGPEIILVLGGRKYVDAIYVLIPLLISVLFQFVYSMFIQIEIFEKQMKIISFATVTAAVLNLGLNFVFIPIYGYVAAGYTTLVGYGVAMILHLITVLKLGYKDLLDFKTIGLGILLSLSLIPLLIFFYKFHLIRIIVASLYILVFILILFKYRKNIITFLKKE